MIREAIDSGLFVHSLKKERVPTFPLHMIGSPFVFDTTVSFMYLFVCVPYIVDGRPEVVGAVRERAVRPVLDAVAAVVRVVHAHARLVVLEVVAPLGVASRAVEVRAPETKNKK